MLSQKYITPSTMSEIEKLWAQWQAKREAKDRKRAIIKVLSLWRAYWVRQPKLVNLTCWYTPIQVHCNDEAELQQLEAVPGYWGCPKKSNLGLSTDIEVMLRMVWGEWMRAVIEDIECDSPIYTNSSAWKSSLGTRLCKESNWWDWTDAEPTSSIWPMWSLSQS